MKKKNLLVSVLSASMVFLSTSGAFAAQTGTVKSLPAATKAALLKTLQANTANVGATTNSKVNIGLKCSDAALAAKEYLPASMTITSNAKYDQKTGNANGSFGLSATLTGMKKALNFSASYQFEGVKNINAALFYLKIGNVQIPDELFKDDTTGMGQTITSALPMLKSSWLKVDFKKLAALDPSLKKSISDASAQITAAASGKATVDPNVLALTKKVLDNATYTIDNAKTTLSLKIPKASPMLKQIINSTEFKNILKQYSSQLSSASLSTTNVTTGATTTKPAVTVDDINKALAANLISFGDIAFKIELSNNNKTVHQTISLPMSFVDAETTPGKKVTYSINLSVDTTTTLGNVNVAKLPASTMSMDVIDLAGSFLK